MLKRENFSIKTLSYNEYSYANPGTKFYYNYEPNGSTLLYSDFFETDGTKTIDIKDAKTFDEQIYNIIKDWKRNYKPEHQIFDSLYWELKITLQDDTNYRFKGYHETPENFEVFEDFLTMLSKC